MIKDIKRGELYLANLSPAKGSEQDGIRPILVIQNNKGNAFSPCIIAAVTARAKDNQPTYVEIGTEYGLSRTSYVMLEQIRTIDKSRLLEYIGTLDDEKMQEVNTVLAFSLGLDEKEE